MSTAIPHALIHYSSEIEHQCLLRKDDILNLSIKTSKPEILLVIPQDNDLALLFQVENAAWSFCARILY